MAERKKIDWEKIELDYRAGLKTLRQIADEHGISHVAINKKAKAEEWSRDLSAKIQKKAQDLVTKNLVTKEVTKEKVVTERQIIDANANVVANVDIRQRKDVARYQDLMNKLFDELDTISGQDNADALEQLSVMIENEGLASEDALIQFKRISSLGSRVKVAKDLGDTIAKLIPLERTIYKMDKEVEERKDPLGDLLKSLTNTSNNNFSVVDDDPEYWRATRLALVNTRNKIILGAQQRLNRLKNRQKVKNEVEKIKNPFNPLGEWTRRLRQLCWSEIHSTWITADAW